MKIEKVSENQIRCTLTKEDLASRQIKISELAYGTEKAKNLFRDMMQQANFEFGFEAEDIPLMIEAIPISSECIILIITKVEDPDELDTRFSKFAPSDEPESDYSAPTSNGANDVIDLFNRLREEHTDPSAESVSAGKPVGNAKKSLKPIKLTIEEPASERLLSPSAKIAILPPKRPIAILVVQSNKLAIIPTSPPSKPYDSRTLKSFTLS